MPVLKNAKHEAVLQAVLVDPKKIGWRAYKKVYPKSSRHAAETAWSRLLKLAEFAARHAELTGAVTAAAVSDAVMSAREVLEELSKLGRANMLDYMRTDKGGDPVLDFSALTRDQAAALSEVTVEDFMDGRGDDAREVRRVKFKLHDKRAALNDLGRHHKLFNATLELDGNITVEIRRFADERRAASSKSKPSKRAA